MPIRERQKPAKSTTSGAASRQTPTPSTTTPSSSGAGGRAAKLRAQSLPASAVITGAVGPFYADAAYSDPVKNDPTSAGIQQAKDKLPLVGASSKDRVVPTAAAAAVAVPPPVKPDKLLGPKRQSKPDEELPKVQYGPKIRGAVNFKHLEQEFQVGTKIHGYEVTRAEEIPGLNIFAIYLTHMKTGALHLHLASNDTENVFSAGFRTTPKDSTGVAHVLEHTVLCGSSKYPVRGTFFKMLTRSLATFMNAITGSDYTIYPFATQNRTDFYNLLSVYLDAVFKPLLTEHDFMQEGWRIEPKDFNDPDSPYEIKGVVYNEMKAIFALPHEELQRKIRNALLPSHTYGNVSGGDPLVIPQLKYDKLLEFHRYHYHPSNARFYTYGDLPLAEHLKFIDKNYLKDFKKVMPKTEVPMEPKWTKPRRMTMYCEPEAVAQKSHAQTTVTVSYLLEPVAKLFMGTCFQILEELLINGPNAPFYHTLIESRLGSDYAPQSGYYGSTKQGYFTVGLKNVKPEDVDKVVKLIDGTFSWLANEGFDQERLQGIVHGMELSLKHEPQNFGIKLLMFLAPVWGHVKDPVDNLIMFSGFRQTFEEEHEKNPELLRELIKKHFVNNPHKLVAVMTPRTDLKDTYAMRERANIDSIVAKLTPKEKEQIIAKIKRFNQRQSEIEDCSCLPLLKLSEIEPSTFRIRRVKSLIFGVPFQATPQATNGITYFRCVVATDHLPPALKQYLPLYCLIITKMGFTGMDFHDGDSSPARAGGFSASPFVAENPEAPGEYEEGVIFYSFSMNRNTNFMFHVWTRIFAEQNFGDARRLAALIRLETSRLVNHIGSTGHVMALWHSASALTPSGRASERYSGFHFVNFMTKLAKDIHEGETLLATIQALESLAKQIMNRTKMRCALNTTESHMQTAKYYAAVFLSNVRGNPTRAWHHFYSHTKFKARTKKTHILVPLPLNSTAKSFPAVHFCHADYAALRVLTELLSWKYLMREVRDKGGAYGTGALLQTTGVFTLYSHRDPRGFKTFQVYHRGIDWVIANGSFGPEDLHEAKLAVFQSVDAPVPPSNKGINFFINGYDEDLLNKHRSAIIEATIADLKRVAEQYLKDAELRGVCIIGPQLHNAELAEEFQIKHLK